MTDLLRFTSSVAAHHYEAGISMALGVPIPPDHRGTNCPPAPFGDTTFWCPVWELGVEFAPLRYVIICPPAELEGVEVEPPPGPPIIISQDDCEDIPFASRLEV